MGRRGPPAKPRSAHEKAGTFRPDRHSGGLPAGSGSIPVAPKELSKAALVEWRRLAPVLAADGLLSDRFRDILATYCETLVEYWQHKRTLAKKGYTITAGNGTTIPHPCVGMKDKCQSQLVKLQRELGMTPAAATGLDLGMGTSSDQAAVEGDPLGEMTNARASLPISSAG